MADPEHVKLARSGVNAINRWRETTFRSPNQRLTRYDLGYRLEDRAAGETFPPEFVYGRPALDLSGASLSGAKLPGADLSHDDLSGADLTGADLRRADLSGANLQAAHLFRSNLSNSKLTEAHMSNCSLVRSNLSNSDLRSADLRAADLSFASMEYSNLGGANLGAAELMDVDLSWANLSKANLRGANLTAAFLMLADLTEADLRGAKFNKTRLDSVIFIRATMGITLLVNCDLSRTIGLNSVRHAGPSTISLDTLAKSNGVIPRQFLEQAGVAEPLITAQDAIRTAARHYPSVLLVGSINDESLARKLSDGLALAKIPNWRLSADDEAALQSGEATLDQTIYYDKLVLLGTFDSLENPLTSRYFAELARGNGRGGGDTLITIGADEALYQRDDRLCSSLKQGLVLDFRGWPDEIRFNAALAYLVRSLSEL